MKKILLMFLCIMFSSILWAESDSTRTEVLNTPVVREKIRVKREIVIPKDPFLASLLSAQMPGVGQMYSGKWLKGCLFLVGTVGCYIIANSYSERATDPLATDETMQKYERLSGVFLITGLGLHIFNIIDAHKTAKRHNIEMLEGRSDLNKWDLGIGIGVDKASLTIVKRI